MWSNPLTYTAIVAALGLIVTIGVLIFKGGAWKGTVDAFMRDTKEALDTLLKRTEPAIERSSPVRLTEFGQEIGRRLEADTDLETSGTHGLPLPDGHTRESGLSVLRVVLRDRLLQLLGLSVED